MPKRKQPNKNYHISPQMAHRRAVEAWRTKHLKYRYGLAHLAPEDGLFDGDSPEDRFGATPNEDYENAPEGDGEVFQGNDFYDAEGNLKELSEPSPEEFLNQANAEGKNQTGSKKKVNSARRKKAAKAAAAADPSDKILKLAQEKGPAAVEAHLIRTGHVKRFDAATGNTIWVSPSTNERVFVTPVLNPVTTEHFGDYSEQRYDQRDEDYARAAAYMEELQHGAPLTPQQESALRAEYYEGRQPEYKVAITRHRGEDTVDTPMRPHKNSPRIVDQTKVNPLDRNNARPFQPERPRGYSVEEVYNQAKAVENIERDLGVTIDPKEQEKLFAQALQEINSDLEHLSPGTPPRSLHPEEKRQILYEEMRRRGLLSEEDITKLVGAPVQNPNEPGIGILEGWRRTIAFNREQQRRLGKSVQEGSLYRGYSTADTKGNPRLKRVRPEDADIGVFSNDTFVTETGHYEPLEIDPALEAREHLLEKAILAKAEPISIHETELLFQDAQREKNAARAKENLDNELLTGVEKAALLKKEKLRRAEPLTEQEKEAALTTDQETALNLAKGQAAREKRDVTPGEASRIAAEVKERRKILSGGRRTVVRVQVTEPDLLGDDLSNRLHHSRGTRITTIKQDLKGLTPTLDAFLRQAEFHPGNRQQDPDTGQFISTYRIEGAHHAHLSPLDRKILENALSGKAGHTEVALTRGADGEPNIEFEGPEMVQKTIRTPKNVSKTTRVDARDDIAGHWEKEVEFGKNVTAARLGKRTTVAEVAAQDQKVHALAQQREEAGEASARLLHQSMYAPDSEAWEIYMKRKVLKEKIERKLTAEEQEGNAAIAMKKDAIVNLVERKFTYRDSDGVLHAMEPAIASSFATNLLDASRGKTESEIYEMLRDPTSEFNQNLRSKPGKEGHPSINTSITEADREIIRGGIPRLPAKPTKSLDPEVKARNERVHKAAIRFRDKRLQQQLGEESPIEIPNLDKQGAAEDGKPPVERQLKFNRKVKKGKISKANLAVSEETAKSLAAQLVTVSHLEDTSPEALGFDSVSQGNAVEGATARAIKELTEQLAEFESSVMTPGVRAAKQNALMQEINRLDAQIAEENYKLSTMQVGKLREGQKDTLHFKLPGLSVKGKTLVGEHVLKYQAGEPRSDAIGWGKSWRPGEKELNAALFSAPRTKHDMRLEEALKLSETDPETSAAQIDALLKKQDPHASDEAIRHERNKLLEEGAALGSAGGSAAYYSAKRGAEEVLRTRAYRKFYEGPIGQSKIVQERDILRPIEFERFMPLEHRLDLWKAKIKHPLTDVERGGETWQANWNITPYKWKYRKHGTIFARDREVKVPGMDRTIKFKGNSKADRTVQETLDTLSRIHATQEEVEKLLDMSPEEVEALSNTAKFKRRAALKNARIQIDSQRQHHLDTANSKIWQDELNKSQRFNNPENGGKQKVLDQLADWEARGANIENIKARMAEEFHVKPVDLRDIRLLPKNTVPTVLAAGLIGGTLVHRYNRHHGTTSKIKPHIPETLSIPYAHIEATRRYVLPNSNSMDALDVGGKAIPVAWRASVRSKELRLRNHRDITGAPYKPGPLVGKISAATVSNDGSWRNSLIYQQHMGGKYMPTEKNAYVAGKKLPFNIDIGQKERWNEPRGAKRLKLKTANPNKLGKTDIEKIALITTQGNPLDPKVQDLQKFYADDERYTDIVNNPEAVASLKNRYAKTLLPDLQQDNTSHSLAFKMGQGIYGDAKGNAYHQDTNWTADVENADWADEDDK